MAGSPVLLQLGSFAGLLCIVAAHLFVRAAFEDRSAKDTFLDVLVGVAIAYAFVDVFPHLAGMQSKLEATRGSLLFTYLAHHAYLVALIGFTVYLGVKTSLEASATPHGNQRVRPQHAMLVLSMCLYNFLIGYMLSEQPTHRPEPAFLFGLAMAAHVLGLNYENRRLNPSAYDKLARYLYIASVVVGWLAGILFEVSDATYALWFAFLAGGIVSTGVATELPRIKSSRSFLGFCLGAAGFCGLLLVLEAYRP